MEVPNALAHLSTNLDLPNYDSSGVAPGLDVVEETTVLLNREMTENAEDLRDIEIGEDSVRHVRYLSLAVFRVCWSITSPYCFLRIKSYGQEGIKNHGGDCY